MKNMLSAKTILRLQFKCGDSTTWCLIDLAFNQYIYLGRNRNGCQPGSMWVYYLLNKCRSPTVYSWHCSMQIMTLILGTPLQVSNSFCSLQIIRFVILYILGRYRHWFSCISRGGRLWTCGRQAACLENEGLCLFLRVTSILGWRVLT